MISVDLPTVVAVIIYSAVALTVTGTILHTILWFKKEYRETKEAILGKTDIKEELRAVIDNDARHMIAETMEGMFVTYAPRLQKAFMVGAEEVARPLMQESMDAMGKGISDAIGGVISEILRHEGAQQFGKQGGIQKVKNAQVREGKKQLIQKLAMDKFGPMAGGVVANLGLDEELLELEESNPEIAAMIMKKIAEGQGSVASQPQRSRSSHTNRPGGWY